jgi:site-specific recombinase XerD
MIDPSARQNTVPVVTRAHSVSTRGALAQEFMKEASRAISPFSSVASTWAGRIRREIARGLLERGQVEILKWLRRVRASRHYGEFITLFLRRHELLPATLPDESAFRQMLTRGRFESAKWPTLTTQDQELIRKYGAWCLNRGGSELTLGNYLSSFKWLVRVMSSKRIPQLSEVTSIHIGILLRRWRDCGLALSTCACLLSHLKSFFEWMHDEMGAGPNPIKRRHFPRYRHKDPTPLSQSEVRRIRGMLDTAFSGTLHRAMFYLIYSTGLRVSEAIAIRGIHICNERRTLEVACGKGGKKASLPVAEGALAALNEWLVHAPPGTSGHLFHIGGHQISLSYADRIRDEIVAASEVRFNWHKLRATFATRLAEMKVGPFELQRLLRHSCLDTALRYVRLSDSSVQRQYCEFVGRLLDSQKEELVQPAKSAIALIET